jgi:outer membrane protein assembly factor BamB
MVYVTGAAYNVHHLVSGTPEESYTTVAYRAATGAQAWTRRYPGTPPAVPSSIAVGRSGRVYVTGSTGYDAYATVAYSADGVQLWAHRYQRRRQEASARWLAVSPTTGIVYVTGYIGTNFNKPNFDFLTIAYRG